MKKQFIPLACLLLFAVHVAAQDVPKAEIYGGYTYLRFNSNGPVNAFSANGGQGSFQFNIDKYLGLVAEMGGVHNGKLTIGSSGILQPDQTAFTYLFGPRVSLNKTGTVTPFFEYLIGGFHNSRSFSVPNTLLPASIPPVSGVTVTPGTSSTKFATSQNALAMAIGGGIDVRVSRRIGFRPIELDYVPTHFSALNIQGLGVVNPTKWQQNLRYSAGLIFRLGGAPPPPPRAACSATPGEVLPWNGPVTATVEPADFNPKHTLNYNWSSTGGTVNGQGATATVDTTNVSPGQYTLTANVIDPKAKQNNTATCSTSFTVKQPANPQVGCSLNPSSVKPGEPITVSVHGSSPDGSRIDKRNFSTSAGAVKEGETSLGAVPSEFTTVATLDTTNVPPGPLTVNVGVTDAHGYSGGCAATANVVAPPPPEVVSETLLSECEFKNPRKLARIDNECKATLDEVALRLQHEPNAKLVVVGFAGEEQEAKVNGVEALRAANAKSYLTAGEAKQQIDASRIEVRTSSERDNGDKAKFYFVPEGGTFTLQNTTVVDEVSLPADRTGASKKK